MKKIILFIQLLFCVQWCLAQEEERGRSLDNVTISGYVKDGGSAETLVGANVIVKELQRGATTNVYGYYAIQVPRSEEDSISLVISYIGYERSEIRVLPQEDLVVDFNLAGGSEVLEEVVITEDANQLLIEQNQMGVQKITSQKLQTIPVAFGESDILKVVQMTAGVQAGSEGTSGFYVRGGGNDQNLILLDEATVYNPEHFFGFFSTFNSDIIKNLEIYKSDFPAKYGGRLSSVLDVQMREGNMKKWEGKGGVGLISSRLTLEGPIVKDRSSFIVSGRRTYFDIFTPAINTQLPADQQIPDYFFYDLNAKVNYILGEKDRIYLSGYFGQDKMALSFGSDNSSTYRLNWGNATGTLRWNHIFSPELFSNTSINASRFKYGDRFSFREFFEFRSSSETYTYSLKQDFDYYARNGHNLRFGGMLTHHLIRPTEFYFGTINADGDLATDYISEEQEHTGQEMALYFSDDWQINKKLALKAGLRFSGFLTKDKKFYRTIEPRASVNYQLNTATSIKASYARMAQYLHQVKFSYLSFLDPWFPSNGFIKPQYSDQVSAGWNRLLWDGKVGITNEYYYKWLQNELDYKNGADFLFIDENYHERMEVGKGWSYGTEVQIQKNEGKLTGWLAYTLSWSRRQFENLNDGNPFPFTYDRRHVVNLVSQYELPKNWLVSLNWTYRTGVAFDLAPGRYFLYGINFSDPEVVSVYTERNNFRMPAYHRLDVGFIKRFKPRKRFRSELAISFYNAYNRRNPFFIYFDEVEDAELSTEDNKVLKYVAKQTSLFPILPSVSWNFEF